MHWGGDVEKSRVLLLDPTGVAALNIDGVTMHLGLGINFKDQLYPLKDKENSCLRNKWSEFKITVIDEISMV